METLVTTVERKQLNKYELHYNGEVGFPFIFHVQNTKQLNKIVK